MDKPRGLVIDDVASTRKLLRAVLAMEGVIAEEAANVGAALDKLASARFDVVLLDLGLGERQSGFDVLRAIRRRPELDRTKVVVVSADGRDLGALAEGLEAGADDFVLKPFHPDVLRARIRAARATLAPSRGVFCATDGHGREGARPTRGLGQPSLPLVDDRVLVSGAVLTQSAVASDVLDVMVDEDDRVCVSLLSPELSGATGALVASIARGALRSALGAGMALDRALASVDAAMEPHRAQLGGVAAGIVRMGASGLFAEVVNVGLPAILAFHGAQARRLGASGAERATSVLTVAPGTLVLMRSRGLTEGAGEREPALLARLAGLHGADLARASTPDLAALVRESFGHGPGSRDVALAAIGVPARAA
jgi:DNA-binding response OmpR family regulator